MSKITESSRGSTCIRCGASGAYSCHYNGPRQHDYGKGRGIKCDDNATAEFCKACDDVFTEGSYANVMIRAIERWESKWDRSEWFLHWCMMTIIRRSNGDTDG